jgi:outer membrane autotransporter protein
MKRVFFLLVFVAAMAAWCSPSFAIQTLDSGDDTINDEGILNGVEITNAAAGQTLTVTNGANIFAANSSSGNVVLPALSAVSTNTSSQDFVTFNGNSTVYGTVGSSGGIIMQISGGSVGTTVNFLGNIDATKFVFTGNSIINLAAGRTATGTAITLTGADRDGTLILNSGSTWGGSVGTGAAKIGAINVMGGSTTAGVSAIIDGADVFAHNISLMTNTLHITGTLNMAADSIITTTLASQSVYGNIQPVGAINLVTGLGLHLTIPTGAYFPVGTRFNIIGPGGAVTASISPTLTPDNPLYTFSVDPITGTTGNKLTIITTGIPMQASSNPVVPVLAVLPATPDVVNVLGPLNALSGQALDDATAQLAPSTPSLAAPLVTFQGIRQFQNLWSSRLDMCSQVSEPNKNNPNCRGNEPRNGWWLKGFEYLGNQNARDGSTGYNSRIYGTMVAYDAPIGLDTRAGLGFGYARSTINGDTFDADTDFDTYQAMAYIGHESGPWFVNGSASIGWNKYSSMRHIDFNGVDRTAHAKYRGQDYTAFASTGFHLSAQEFTITPLASLLYSRVHLNGYTETGAGGVNLKVKSQNYDFLESGLGVKVERYFSNSNGTSYVPEVHFNWYHELSNPELKQTAEYTAAGSSSFRTSGLKTDDDTFNVGGGLTLLSCACSATTWSLEAVYDYYWNNTDYSANQVMVRLTSRF